MINVQTLGFVSVDMWTKMGLPPRKFWPYRYKVTGSWSVEIPVMVSSLLAFFLLVLLCPLDAMASSTQLGEQTGYLGTALEKSFILVQDKAADNTEGNNSGTFTKHSPARTKTPAKNEKRETSSTRKPEPLKPFVPSKKIEADQAVDFPYDI